MTVEGQSSVDDWSSHSSVDIAVGTADSITVEGQSSVDITVVTADSIPVEGQSSVDITVVTADSMPECYWCSAGADTVKMD